MSNMALPSFIVMRASSRQPDPPSPLEGLSIIYQEVPAWARGFVYPGGGSVFWPYAKIEVERAKYGNLVHLRFSVNNKYWRRDENSMILADSTQPEEDTSKLSCTLFEPTVRSYSDGMSVSFRHVQSDGRVPVRVNYKDRFGRLWVGGGDATMFALINWSTLIKLPKHVTFKGSNGKYLKPVWIEGRPYLQFSANDGTTKETAYEASNDLFGRLYFKSSSLDKYWRCSNDWIWADFPTVVDDSLFWPIKIGKNTITLRNSGNCRYCSMHKRDCLSAVASQITSEARFEVGESVLKRDIYNVRFRLEDARVYDVEPFLAGTATAENHTDYEASKTVTMSFEESKSYSFTNSLSIATGVETTIKTGVPFIAEGEISISVEVTASFEWNQTTTETTRVEDSFTVALPPRTKVRVNYVGTRGKCNIPFSYTQEDRLSTTGAVEVFDHIDGVYAGVNSFNYHFEASPTARL